MQQKTTDDLDEQLKNMDPGQLDGYLKENRGYLAEAEKEFYYYMKDILEEKRILLKDLYVQAGVKERYGSKILRQEKRTADRNLIIRLCLAGHLNLDETNRALKLYGMRGLYSKDPRDACLIVAINNRKFDVYEVDEMLRGKGFESLFKKVEWD